MKIVEKMSFKTMIMLLATSLLCYLPINYVISVNGAILNSETINVDDIFNTDFEAEVTRLMDEDVIPSIAVSVIYQDEMVWANGYGEQSDLNTIYWIGSITKTITATAVLQLYDQNLINLDEDINQYIPFDAHNPSFPSENITFRHLLSHRSSLSDANNSLWAAHILNDTSWAPELDYSDLLPFPDYLEKILEQDPSKVWLNASKPGEIFQYSNIGFDLLAYLVQIISNQTYEEYVSQYVFQPLSMTDTGFFFSDFNPDQFALPHELNPYNQTSKTLEISKVFRAPGSACVSSTVTDLSKFLIAHMNGGIYESKQILNSTTVDLMHANALGNHQYGLGWSTAFRDDKLLPSLGGHGGTTKGYSIQMFYNDEKDIGVNLFTNQWQWGQDIGKSLYEFIFETAYEITETSTPTSAPYSIFPVIISICIMGIISVLQRKPSY